MNTGKDFEIVATIREYENSVAMPDSERLTYLDARGGIHLKDGDGTAPARESYAKRCADYLRFGDEVDLATCGGMNPLDQLKVCDNPSRSDTLLAVLAEADCDKLPLVVSIKPDGKGNYALQEIETNIILTVFGKDNFDRYFESVITPDKVIYYNEKQGRKLETLAERQLFRCHPVACDLDSVIIRRPQCIVNKENAGQDAYSIASEAKESKAASKEISEHVHQSGQEETIESIGR